MGCCISEVCNLKTSPLVGIIRIQPHTLTKHQTSSVYCMHHPARAPVFMQVCNAQLASKEGRIAPQLMAHILQHLLARDPAAIIHGWVLEGWPKTLAAARLMACSNGPEGGKQGDRAPYRRVTGAPIKVSLR